MALYATTVVSGGVYPVQLDEDYYARTTVDTATNSVCVHGTGEITVHIAETHLHIKISPTGEITTTTPDQGGPIITKNSQRYIQPEE